MEHFAALDVSIKETGVGVIDSAGRVVREVKVPTESDAILAILTDEAFSIKRIGLQAGPLSKWLYSELAEAGLPMICVETRHMRAALSAQINKGDHNDARDVAHIMRVSCIDRFMSRRWPARSVACC
jgi:transposase